MSLCTVRLNENDIALLTKLIDGKQCKTPGSAIKAVLKFCYENDVDFTQDISIDRNKHNKMIEQIHVMMPQVMYMLSFLLSNDLTQLDDKKAKALREKALQFINKTCSAMNDIEYEFNYFDLGKNHFKTIPSELDQGNGPWK